MDDTHDRHVFPLDSLSGWKPGFLCTYLEVLMYKGLRLVYDSQEHRFYIHVLGW